MRFSCVASATHFLFYEEEKRRKKMKELFELDKRERPKTLEDCAKPDPVVSCLYSWANTLRSWGIYACVVFVLFGILDGLTIAFAVKENVFWAFMMEFVPDLISGVIAYLSFVCVGVLLIAFANVIYNTRITANFKMYSELPVPKAMQEAPNVSVKPDAKAFEAGYWVCKECKIKNPAGAKTCYRCGSSEKMF